MARSERTNETHLTASVSVYHLSVSLIDDHSASPWECLGHGHRIPTRCIPCYRHGRVPSGGTSGAVVRFTTPWYRQLTFKLNATSFHRSYEVNSLPPSSIPNVHLAMNDSIPNVPLPLPWRRCLLHHTRDFSFERLSCLPYLWIFQQLVGNALYTRTHHIETAIEKSAENNGKMNEWMNEWINKIKLNKSE